MALISIVLIVVAALSEASYDRDNRVQYMVGLLDAIRATALADLENGLVHVEVLSRSVCRSQLPSARMRCLIDEVKKFCGLLKRKDHRTRCGLYYDVLILNKLNESQFISLRDRYRVMRQQSRSYSEAIQRELSYRYGALVTEMMLSPHYQGTQTDLARAIDGFCSDLNDVGRLTWQGCAGALVWFIAGTRKSQS